MEEDIFRLVLCCKAHVSSASALLFLMFVVAEFVHTLRCSPP
jgi:hypothetical protein